MNYFELYPGDYLRDTSRLSLADHGAYLRLMLAYYAEESPLPEALAELYVIAGAVTTADRAAVRKVAERYFPVANDGLRRNPRVDAEIGKAQGRMAGGGERRIARKNNEAERQARTRARRTMLFEDLRNAGVMPHGMSSMAELKALHVTHVTGAEAVTHRALSSVTEGVPSRAVAGVNTGIQAPEPTSTPETSVHALQQPEGVTEALRACELMRRAGCVGVHPRHAGLRAAIAEGVTAEVLRDVAVEASSRSPPIRHPFAWAIQAARHRHAGRVIPPHTPPTGGHHAPSRPGSADYVAEQRQHYEQRIARGSAGTRRAGAIDVEYSTGA
ncbi:YdaU family protein [uncultured Stenotrophomonas sp.]|uniref:YdaU family protein n=1 Tax=uncultured Stenotrophomonas sp. TaxID=165438 RepID=UPI0025E484AD|nr:YdaU family protein [uncultured Stenotrophomonas sp.]